MPDSQNSRNIITLEFIKYKTSIIMVLLATMLRDENIIFKSRTASFLASQGAFLGENRDCVVKLTQDRYSLATESDYVRGKLAEYANELLALGIDGFRIDAAKRRPHCRWPSRSQFHSTRHSRW
jgi:hypothetical protein